MTRDDILAQAQASVEKHLAEEHPPGGALGYMRWKATRKTLPMEVDVGEKTISRAVAFSGNRGWWIVRVILSLVFLPVSIHAMVKPLSKVDAPPEPASPEDNAESPAGESTA